MGTAHHDYPYRSRTDQVDYYDQNPVIGSYEYNQPTPISNHVNALVQRFNDEVRRKQQLRKKAETSKAFAEDLNRSFSPERARRQGDPRQPDRPFSYLTPSLTGNSQSSSPDASPELSSRRPYDVIYAQVAVDGRAKTTIHKRFQDGKRVEDAGSLSRRERSHDDMTARYDEDVNRASRTRTAYQMNDNFRQYKSKEDLRSEVSREEHPEFRGEVRQYRTDKAGRPYRPLSPPASPPPYISRYRDFPPVVNATTPPPSAHSYPVRHPSSTYEYVPPTARARSPPSRFLSPTSEASRGSTPDSEEYRRQRRQRRHRPHYSSTTDIHRESVRYGSRDKLYHRSPPISPERYHSDHSSHERSTMRRSLDRLSQSSSHSPERHHLRADSANRRPPQHFGYNGAESSSADRSLDRRTRRRDRSKPRSKAPSSTNLSESQTEPTPYPTAVPPPTARKERSSVLNTIDGIAGKLRRSITERRMQRPPVDRTAQQRRGSNSTVSTARPGGTGSVDRQASRRNSQSGNVSGGSYSVPQTYHSAERGKNRAPLDPSHAQPRRHHSRKIKITFEHNPTRSDSDIEHLRGFTEYKGNDVSPEDHIVKIRIGENDRGPPPSMPPPPTQPVRPRRKYPAPPPPVGQPVSRSQSVRKPGTQSSSTYGVPRDVFYANDVMKQPPSIPRDSNLEYDEQYGTLQSQGSRDYRKQRDRPRSQIRGRELGPPPLHYASHTLGRHPLPASQQDLKYSKRSSSSERSHQIHGTKLKRSRSSVADLGGPPQMARKPEATSGSDTGTGASQFSRPSGSQGNPSVYLHSAAIVDIPARPARHPLSHSQEDIGERSGTLKKSKSVTRSLSVLAPWKPKSLRQDMNEVNYSQDQGVASYQTKPPRPPRKKIKGGPGVNPSSTGHPSPGEGSYVQRRKSMPKDSRLAGLFRRKNKGIPVDDQRRI
ncbi:unnamed protein product [Cyprideis torosa]|uniref:Uncharacterized protein n=1 Tax=Cyprideis torosa TaxID=163714 RepID=A0A7R8W5B7_9CRUS|nr:unnamed protein product [Cyprideis torosa]CAG0882712.1 unnamed protein product [Cyprideis torosa]